MAFISAKLDDTVAEPKAVPEGEYALRIMKAERSKSKNGNDMTVVVIRVEDDPNAALIYHYILDVTKDMPADQKAMRALELKRFLQTFGVPFQIDGYDPEDLPGATANVMLVQEEGDDGVVRNRLRLPRLKE